MVRPASPSLTDHELSIMRILWEESPQSVAGILESFPRKPKPAYTSLLTALKAMEKKGLVGHETEGKAHLFHPLLQRAKYRRNALQRVLGKVFDGNAYDLAVNLIKTEKLVRSEIEALKKMLEEM